MRNIVSLMVMMLCSAAVMAQDAAKAKLERGIRAAYAEMETLTCSYTLARKVSMLTDVAREEGALTYTKSRRTLVLASVTIPGDSTIMTPLSITSVSGGKRQTMDAMKNTALRQMLDVITACFSGDFGAVRSAGNVSVRDTGPTTVVGFTPTDRRTLRHISSIELTFGNDDYGLRQMVVTQKGDDFMAYTFGKKKTQTRTKSRK